MREGLHKIVSYDETIVAVSTPLGHSGIGIVRLSGRHCLNIARRCFKPHSQNSEFRHRTALLGVWHDGEGKEIDEVIITFFRSPHSYTGEDVLEIGAHGNPELLRRIVESARGMGARLAGPGEFTLRAVAHGKMDLVQAEAVRDFIDAQTEQQAKIARRQMEGTISKRIRPLKEGLIQLIAHLEAGIDFADDDVDVPANTSIAERICALQTQLALLRNSFSYGKILSDGLSLAILGKPNVGKSSLFNRLIGADRSIVADIPGTTRDVVTETVSLEGVPLCFADTAGIRDTTDVVEGLGVTRTLETLADADLALAVLDGSRMLDENDFETLRRARRIPHVIVINKNDLPQEDITLNGAKPVRVSSKTGQGFEELYAVLREFLLSRKSSLQDDYILTNVRQHEAVADSVAALCTAEQAVSAGIPHEMVLLDLYRGLAALDELTGDVVTEDILQRIFSTFCIGK